MEGGKDKGRGRPQRKPKKGDSDRDDDAMENTNTEEDGGEEALANKLGDEPAILNTIREVMKGMISEIRTDIAKQLSDFQKSVSAERTESWY